MNLHILDQAPPKWLGEALDHFEREFLYPLGASDRFSISHGESYLPFFRAMGEPSVLIAEREGQVLGTLAFVRRMLKLRLPDSPAGDAIIQRAHFLCDLKVTPSARGSAVLARLMEAAKQLVESNRSHACYSIIMDGTSRLPTSYTGRLGVPLFEKIGQIVILRLSLRNEPGRKASSSASLHAVESIHKAISPVGYVPTTGLSECRSLMTPIPCIDPQGRACGVIEDTRKGKRLFLESGEEMLSAHLSRFAYSDPLSGAQLVRQATSICAGIGYPAMFVSIPVDDAPHFLSHLDDLHVHQAPASVYAHDLLPGMKWWVDTAEI